MPRQKLQITSINGGFAPTQDFGGDGTYQFGLGIDPDYSLTASFYRKSGALMPTRYEVFSSALVTGSPNWLITNPKNTKLYTYTKDSSSSSVELASTTLFSDGNLVAYWKLEDTADSKGAFTLTNNGAIPFAAAKFTNGGDLGASNTTDYFSVANDLGITSGAISVSMWVKLKTEIGSGIYTFFEHGDAGVDVRHQINYEYNTGTRRIAFNRQRENVSDDKFVYNVTLGTSDFYHLVLTYDGTTVKGYVNGVLVGSIASSGNGASGVDIDYTNIGAGRTITSGTIYRYASMIADDVSVFSRALTEAEVLTIYSNSGNFISYNNSLGDETLLSAVADGIGNGMAYYNNYIYLATNTTIARYGPLDGTIAYTASFWVTTLGKTALNNKVYPSIAGVSIPNHPMHVHGDNSLYIGDTLNGQGIIHKIKTSKTTNEGDTNDGSTYNALDLPFGFFPTDIESYGTDLAIVAIQTTDSDANQGRAALFLWDTVSDTFYAGPIYLPDPLGTALLNVNGQIFVWSGSSRQGCRLSKYLGGVQLSEVLLIEEACPPFAGSVAADGSRLYWGGFTVYPVVSACVYSYGSKDARLTQGLHIPIKTSSAGATPNATSLALYSQTGFSRTKLVVGWKDASTQGIDKVSTSATFANRFRSQPFNIGQKFRVARLRIPLGTTLATNMSITPTIYFDDEADSMALTAITSTNFTTAVRKVLYKDTQLDSKKGENNFFLDLAWAGTVECPVKFPIEIEIETFDNEQTT